MCSWSTVPSWPKATFRAIVLANGLHNECCTGISTKSAQESLGQQETFLLLFASAECVHGPAAIVAYYPGGIPAGSRGRFLPAIFVQRYGMSAPSHMGRMSSTVTAQLYQQLGMHNYDGDVSDPWQDRELEKRTLRRNLLSMFDAKKWDYLEWSDFLVQVQLNL